MSEGAGLVAGQQDDMAEITRYAQTFHKDAHLEQKLQDRVGSQMVQKHGHHLIVLNDPAHGSESRPKCI